MQKVLVLVEGQTEERFVKDILQPHLWAMGVHPQPKIATTKRVKQGAHFKGGLVSFAKVEDDLRRLLGDTGAALVTTMLDFYGLPSDFPKPAVLSKGSGVARAMELEQALEQHFGNTPRLRAYLMVHEFEGLLYSAPDVLPAVMNEPQKTRMMEADRASAATPEDINDGEATHPSRRIQNYFPGYRKRLHGPLATARIGLQLMRAECRHFDTWLSSLEALGE